MQLWQEEPSLDSDVFLILKYILQVEITRKQVDMHINLCLLKQLLVAAVEHKV